MQRASPTADRWFYPAMATLLAAVIVAGFTPTFYARPVFFAGAPLAWLVRLHGGVATAWVALFTAQAWLMGLGLATWHRRLGRAGAAVAVAMMAVGGGVIANLERAHGAEPAAVLAAHVFANAAPLTAFGALALAGIWQRGVPARHKRLLLLATVVLAPAALGRLFARLDVPDLALPAYAALAFANAAYDAVVLRRVHAVALGGAAALIALDVATTQWLSAVGG